MFKVAGGQTPTGTELYMQVHLGIKESREAGRCLTYVGKFRRFIDRERIGASKLDEQQVVLSEVVTKRRFGEPSANQLVKGCSV